MTTQETEKALDEKIIESWATPAQDRIKKMSAHLMERMVELDQLDSPELKDFDLAA